MGESEGGRRKKAKKGEKRAEKGVIKEVKKEMKRNLFFLEFLGLVAALQQSSAISCWTRSKRERGGGEGERGRVQKKE